MDELKARIKELAKVAIATQTANTEAHENAARALVSAVLDRIESQAQNGATFGEFKFSNFPDLELMAISDTVTKRAEKLARTFGLTLVVQVSLSLVMWSFTAEVNNDD